jgi:hypothetical protein
MTNKIPARIEIQEGENSMTFMGLFEPPNLSFKKNEIQIPYMSTSTWMKGQQEWSSVKIEFFDYEFENFSLIDNWVRAYADTITGRLSYAENYKKNILITTYNESEKRLSSWQLIGARLISFNTNFSTFEHNKLIHSFPDILFKKLTRKVLIEKTNHPTMQIFTEIEIAIDNARYIY